MEEKIKANAELLIQTLGPMSGIDFGYSRESIAWVDVYLERVRASGEMDESMARGLTDVIGSFLGECVVRRYGGRWRQEEGQWCVAFDDENAAFPFAGVRKQIEKGPEESILVFFDTVPVLFAGRIDPHRK